MCPGLPPGKAASTSVTDFKTSAGQDRGCRVRTVSGSAALAKLACEASCESGRSQKEIVIPAGSLSAFRAWTAACPAGRRAREIAPASQHTCLESRADSVLFGGFPGSGSKFRIQVCHGPAQARVPSSPIARSPARPRTPAPCLEGRTRAKLLDLRLPGIPAFRLPLNCEASTSPSFRPPPARPTIRPDLAQRRACRVGGKGGGERFAARWKRSASAARTATATKFRPEASSSRHAVMPAGTFAAPMGLPAEYISVRAGAAAVIGRDRRRCGFDGSRQQG